MLYLILPMTQAAGIIPTSLALCFVCGTSSLCGTFLAQTIAAIPGIPLSFYIPYTSDSDLNCAWQATATTA